MSIKEKLKEAKKKTNKAIAIGAAALAVAVTAAPKAKANESKSEKLSATKVETTEIQKQRHQMFEAAVRANLPKEEIAKYVDFPEIIPVDKNGQLDEKKVKVLLHESVTNHMDAVRNFYKDIAPTHRSGASYYAGGGMGGSEHYQNTDKKGFDKALATFIKDVAGNSKETDAFLKNFAKANDSNWTKIADQADSKFKIDNDNGKFGLLMVSYLGAIAGLIPIVLAGELKKEYRARVRIRGILFTACCVSAMVFAFKDRNKDMATVQKRLSDPKEALAFLQEGAKQMHDAYLTGVIKTEQNRQEEVAQKQFNQKLKEFRIHQK